MRSAERVILFTSVILNTLLLLWVGTVANDLLRFQKQVNEYMDATTNSIKMNTEAIDHHSNAIMSLAGLSKGKP